MKRYLVRALVVAVVFGGVSTSMAQQESRDDRGAAIEQLRLRDLTDRIESLTTEVQTLRDAVDGLRSEVKARGAWEPFGQDLKRVLEDPVEFEYGLLRNGGFRTLTPSEWNGGWRVMTSPYMTGDTGQFRLGGSMWIWGTRDPRDDGGVFHLYYLSTNQGAVLAYNGDGLRGNGSNSGEGTIYRRRR